MVFNFGLFRSSIKRCNAGWEAGEGVFEKNLSDSIRGTARLVERPTDMGSNRRLLDLDRNV